MKTLYEYEYMKSPNNGNKIKPLDTAHKLSMPSIDKYRNFLIINVSIASNMLKTLK